jgi:hypothetical protein
MKLRLQNINKSRDLSHITNIKFKKMLKKWKVNHTNIEDMYKINDICQQESKILVNKRNLRFLLSSYTKFIF